MTIRSRTAAGVALACLLASLPAAPAAAAPDPPLAPNPHSHGNMGYCSPYLGGGGLGVRPTINHILAKDGEALGYDSPGDLYSDRARSTTDRQCLPRR